MPRKEDTMSDDIVISELREPRLADRILTMRRLVIHPDALTMDELADRLELLMSDAYEIGCDDTWRQSRQAARREVGL
jgi:hypothetical protein